VSPGVDVVVEIASWLCLSLGALFCVIGGLGLMRLPDLYARTHGAAITDTLGAGSILVGLMLQAGPSLVTIKLILVLLFMLLTGPAAGHALVHAARTHGIAPAVGDGEDVTSERGFTSEASRDEAPRKESR
jgi:multicomponent Na+:H+ antiporter subunit G